MFRARARNERAYGARIPARIRFVCGIHMYTMRWYCAGQLLAESVAQRYYTQRRKKKKQKTIVTTNHQIDEAACTFTSLFVHGFKRGPLRISFRICYRTYYTHSTAVVTDIENTHPVHNCGTYAHVIVVRYVYQIDRRVIILSRGRWVPDVNTYMRTQNSSTARAYYNNTSYALCISCGICIVTVYVYVFTIVYNHN